MKRAKFSLLVVGIFVLIGTLVTGCGGGVKPPTAVINSPQSGAQFAVNQSVEFSGSAKDDAGKEVTKDIVFEWDFGDGSTGTGQTASHAYSAAGTYTVKLTVKTAAQAKETSPKLESKQTAQIEITVKAALSVAISASVTEGPAPLEVSFTAEVQGTAASYNWDFGDGSTSTEANPTHTFTTEGTYTVKLIVTAPDGSTASAEKTITVTAPQQSSQGQVHIVKMVTTKDGKNFFDPAELTIKVGDTVRWVNECEEGVACTHSAQAYPDKIPAGAEAFDSTLLTAQGQTYEYTFTVPGEYEYFCFPHEALGMKGKIIVQP
ncbi:MAG: PKD domain-containing protein [Candidatus Bipolaricaulia bacterium]